MEEKNYSLPEMLAILLQGVEKKEILTEEELYASTIIALQNTKTYQMLITESNQKGGYLMYDYYEELKLSIDYLMWSVKNNKPEQFQEVLRNHIVELMKNKALRKHILGLTQNKDELAKDK